MGAEEKYYIKVGNCYVAFLGLFHTPTMRADHNKADSFDTREEAKIEADKRGVRNYKIVRK